jgi:hypothetical protein
MAKDVLKTEPQKRSRKRAKKKTFSALKAVKANARERVGQPKAERIIDDDPRQKRKDKYKPKLEDLLSSNE